MNKTYRTENYRSFLINGLPEPLTRASSHLQLFDNYIENSRMRLRTIREPETKAWTWILQQRFPLNANDFATWKYADIYLNENEHNLFEGFEGREIRKNRYFHVFDSKEFEFDVYLGKLWGLNILNVYFETDDEMKSFELPNFVVYEVSNSEFFIGEVLVEKTFEDVQNEFSVMRGQ